MQAGWLFWGVATALTLGVLGVVLAPLLGSGRRAERRAAYDMQVYRDQLREVEADLARGAVTGAEADAVRAEVGRRLLAAADAEAAETAAAAAPRAASRAAAVVLALGLAALAGGLYARLGAPGAPDQPLAARLAALAEARAARPTQAEVEAAAAAPAAAAAAAPDAPPEDLALVERLRATVAGRPDDVEGHRLLARSEAALGRWSAARAAQQRLVDLLGPDAATQDLVDLAEFMILAAGGYVSPEAEDRLAEVLARDPAHPVARYYSGLALLQAGRADLAFPIWARLLEEGPPDAPWVRPIAMRIDEVAALAGRPAPPLPDDAAAGLDAADRAAMIEGMVAGLADRLAADGGPPEDWARLIRSLGVLGRADEATAILREARETFAADPAARTLLDAAAAEAGLGG